MERRQAKRFGRRVVGICAFFILLFASGCSPWIALPAEGHELVQPSPIVPADTPTAAPSPIPTFTPTVTPDPGCTATIGNLQDYSFDSRAMGKPFQFIVYTPPCYDPQNGSVYPALYMLHGQSFSQDQWVRLGMPAAADKLVASGELPPFLIVMPYEEYNLNPPFERGFDKVFIDELIPWVDNNFATCTQASCRVIAGLSRGGSWALYLGVAHMDIFGAIGAHSTAPFFGMAGYLSYFLREFGKESFPRLYVDFGESDSLLPYMTDFKKSLDGYKLPYEYRLRPGNHTEDYWSSHVEEYLRWYWKDWVPPQP